MPYWPRSEILSRLEHDYGVRLISADVIHDVDLNAIMEVLHEQERRVASLTNRIDDLETEAQEIADDIRMDLESEIDELKQQLAEARGTPQAWEIYDRVIRLLRHKEA